MDDGGDHNPLFLENVGIGVVVLLDSHDVFLLSKFCLFFEKNPKHVGDFSPRNNRHEIP